MTRYSPKTFSSSIFTQSGTNSPRFPCRLAISRTIDEQVSASQFHALSRKKYGGTVIDILEIPEEE